MNSHVVAKVSLKTETYSTLFAGVRLFSSVNSHVVAKASVFTETFSTLLADVRLFSSVNLYMPVKTYFISETFSTVLATERVLPMWTLKPKASEITSSCSSLLSFFSCGNLFSL